MSHVRSLRGWARPAHALFLSLTVAAAGPALGQEEAPAAASPGRDPLGRDTPRGAMTGFLVATREGDFERGAEYLEIKGVNPELSALGGAEVARRVKTVLDQGLWVDLDGLSEEPAGDVEDGWPARDRVGVAELAGSSFDVFLRRTSGDDGSAIWKVAAATVARASAAYENLGISRLERFLPGLFFEVRVLEVLLWQWIALLVLLVVAWIASWILAFGVSRFIRPLVARTRTDLDDQLLEIAIPPLRLALGVVVMLVAVRTLGLAVPAMELVSHLLRATALIAVVWLLSRFVDLVAMLVEQRLMQRGDPGVRGLVTPGKRTVKALIGIVVFVALLDNFGFDVAALIAGLGVGGIAVALAAQKTVENLFGGVTLFADQPVRVGDFCRFGDKIGTVEEIGLRSTRVRSLDRTIITIPNAEFASIQLENFAKRDRIRLHAMIGVIYDTTPDQMRYVLVEIRRMLYAHEKVLPDPARVRFVGFGACSLDLEIFAYAATSDWNEFLGVREDIYLRIMDIIDEAGTSFAFPSQTLYLGRDAGVDDEKVERVERDVQMWRERQEVFLPDFPPETIAELDDTIKFPAEGTPAAR
jgi:MscS family membrane protein